MVQVSRTGNRYLVQKCWVVQFWADATREGLKNIMLAESPNRH